MNHKKLKERILEMLKERGESIRDLSYEVRLSPEAISVWLRDPKRDIRLKNAIKIADHFGITLDELVKGK